MGAAFRDWVLLVSPFVLAEPGGAGDAGTWLSERRMGSRPGLRPAWGFP